MTEAADDFVEVSVLVRHLSEQDLLDIGQKACITCGVVLQGVLHVAALPPGSDSSDLGVFCGADCLFDHLTEFYPSIENYVVSMVESR